MNPVALSKTVVAFANTFFNSLKLRKKKLCHEHGLHTVLKKHVNSFGAIILIPGQKKYFGNKFQLILVDIKSK